MDHQAVIRDLHEPIVNAVVRHVHAAYTDVLPGLPYCEMPVISITGELNPSLTTETQNGTIAIFFHDKQQAHPFYMKLLSVSIQITTSTLIQNRTQRLPHIAPPQRHT